MNGYKGHKAGSRKEACHKLFDEQGPDVALTWGVEKGLAHSTVASWCKSWGKGVTIKPAKASTVVRSNAKHRLVWSKRPIALVAEGPQQSVIRFLDTNTTQAVASDEVVEFTERVRLHARANEPRPDRVRLTRGIQRSR